MSLHLTPVPKEPPPVIPIEDFPDIAREHWTATKVSYADAFQSMASLHRLLHTPGEVRVLGVVTGALSEARRMRAEVDRMIVTLDAIVQAGRRTGEATR